MTLSLARRAALWPDRLALVDAGAGERYTYQELADRAAAAAGRLAAWEVGQGDRLVVLAENSADLLAQLFGAWRREATLAPVSHRMAPDTIATLIDRIDPELVVYQESLADAVAAVERTTVTQDQYLERAPAADAGAGGEPGERSEDAPAPLFLHTGGTTGIPKVVPISAAQLEWNAITESVAWGLDEDAVSVTVLPLFHTGGWNLLTLPTLYAGGEVVLQPAFDPGRTLSLIEDHGATQVFGVAAIFQAMAAHDAFERTDFATVDWFMSGGGPCPKSVMEPYRERGETFVQGYGLTEGGPNNLYVDPDRDDLEAKSDRVGRPFPDCRARIVDEDGDAIEGEGTGELEVAGPVAAETYLETVEGTFDGEWVSTDDVAHRDADGDYAIVGRLDNMFVSGGENVYPEEIEDALEDHERVAAAGVVPVSHEKWGQVPKAIIQPVAGAALDEATLEAYAREQLADYEQPQEYVFEEDLPETGAGKLDREAITEHYGE